MRIMAVLSAMQQQTRRKQFITGTEVPHTRTRCGCMALQGEPQPAVSYYFSIFLKANCGWHMTPKWDKTQWEIVTASHMSIA